jgi:serine/threonine protein kinase
MVGSDGIVKILDLGLCNIMGGASKGGAAPRQGEKETITGTPAYMSPEQIYGDEDIDVRSDIYCLGATLYHLVTGQVFFPEQSNDDTLRSHVTPEVSAPDPRSLNPDVSEGLVRILSKMCAKERENRYANWGEVLADSKILQSGELPDPLPEGVPTSICVRRS